MPAQIESFVSAREDAWHQLGTVLDHNFSAEEAMNHAKLGGWNVRTQKLWTPGPKSDEIIEVPGKYATVRDNPFNPGEVDVLGVVGEYYEPIQNESHTALLDALVDESGAHFETAGSLLGGKEVFVTMKLPKSLKVGGRDEVDLYVAALNSHDGTTAFRLILTPIRIVCKNTQTFAIKNARAKFSIRHTVSASGRIQAAREALGLTFRSIDAFEAEAEKMIEKELTDREFTKIIRRIYPVGIGSLRTIEDKPTERMKEAYNRKLGTLKELFVNGENNEQIRNTRWGGYQAVMEYIDHYSSVHGEQAEFARAQKTLLNPGTLNAKIAAFKAFQA